MGALGVRRLVVMLLWGTLAAWVALGLTGCGAGSTDRPSAEPAATGRSSVSDSKPAAPSGDTAGPDAANPVTVAPPTGDEPIPPDGGGGGGGPVLTLPRLPVGGGAEFTDESQDLQCAPISWTAFGGDAGLDRGVSVEVEGYELDTAYFTTSAGGCDQPSCDRYVFDADHTGCVVAVRTVRPQPAGVPGTDLRLVGKARCDGVDATACQAFIAAVAAAADDDSIIDLKAPDPSTSTESVPTESVPTEPAPTEPAPTDVNPTEPNPTGPSPTAAAGPTAGPTG